MRFLTFCAILTMTACAHRSKGCEALNHASLTAEYNSCLKAKGRR